VRRRCSQGVATGPHEQKDEYPDDAQDSSQGAGFDAEG
jgi:hypothetical protein